MDTMSQKVGLEGDDYIVKQNLRQNRSFCQKLEEYRNLLGGISHWLQVTVLYCKHMTNPNPARSLSTRVRSGRGQNTGHSSGEFLCAWCKSW